MSNNNRKHTDFLADRPVLRFTSAVRPRGVRVFLAEQPFTLPFGRWEFAVSVALGFPDPLDLPHDFLRFPSASNESGRVRSMIRRLRESFERLLTRAFGKGMKGIGHVIILHDREERSYRFHPSLAIVLDADLLGMPDSIFGRELKEAARGRIAGRKPAA